MQRSEEYGVSAIDQVLEIPEFERILNEFGTLVDRLRHVKDGSKRSGAF